MHLLIAVGQHEPVVLILSAYHTSLDIGSMSDESISTYYSIYLYDRHVHNLPARRRVG